MELLARGQTADPVARFQNHDPVAGSGEENRNHQTVVTATDDDGVPALAHSSPDPSRADAASCPDAPMMPPPGWVPEPHIQRFLIGVL